MKVSLILPVYKAREDWLEQCLESIKAQTYPVELIRVDDVEGAWKARNEGLKRATGDLIAFCDADDYMEPDAIENMVKAMELGVDLVCGSFHKFGNFEMTVTFGPSTLTRSDVANYVLCNLQNPRTNQMLSGCWAKLYRRQYGVQFPALRTAEDMAFNFAYLELCKKIRFIPEVVYHNRKHSNSLSTTYDGSRSLFDFIDGLKYVKTFLDPYVFEDSLEEALDISKVYHSMLYAQRIGPDALKKVFP